MAQEGSEGSVANSSSTSNFWDLQTNSLSNSWTNVIPTWHPPNDNRNSNSSCEEEISISNSFTNTSNHSGLSDDNSSHHQLVRPPSSNELTGEPTSENHLWSHVLLGAGNNGNLHNNQDVGENFVDALSSSKNLTIQMFEPACDYLKKMDNSWELIPNSATFNNLQKHLNSFNGSLMEHERLSNLSNLVSNWSIGLPFPEANRQISIPSTTCHDEILINSNHHPQEYSQSHDFSNHPMKRDMSNASSSCEVTGGIRGSNNNSWMFPCYGQDVDQSSSDQTSFLGSFKTNSLLQHQMDNNPVLTRENVNNNNKSYYGSSRLEEPWSNSTKNLSDIISFNSFLNKPLMDVQPSKHCSSKPSNSSEAKKHGHENTSSAKGSGRGDGNSSGEGKKKRSEDHSATVFKKPKQDNSTVSSLKVQVPKVKLGDRITALQQIVSPFGKTDTASVLQEAIGYIKFLQEQVQLLSNPYVKPNSTKNPWGLLERKDHANNIGAVEVKLDLKSRGLCLVPISCTPQVHRENSVSDYWTPIYRGSLYR
ncbi:hypothetical protein MKX01_036104 [Papaver californicum]|nr:hypothetical protein MKX01_036104 [Papaver californicum]